MKYDDKEKKRYVREIVYAKKEDDFGSVKHKIEEKSSRIGQCDISRESIETPSPKRRKKRPDKSTNDKYWQLISQRIMLWRNLVARNTN